MKKKVEITDTTLCCSVCGGLNVERKVWADANADEVLEDVSNNDEDTWCRDCEANTGLMFKTEWDSQKRKGVVMNNLLTNRQWNIEGTWYAPEEHLKRYKSVIKTGYITMSSSAGDWEGMFVQKLNGWYYFIPFSQENNYPRSGFTLYTGEVFTRTSVISEEVWEEVIKDFIEIYY